MEDSKIMPHDLDAEEAVTGSLLVDGDCIRLVSKIIKPTDFYYEHNSVVYQSCLNLYERREAINTITVARELDRLGKLAEIGGAAHLSHLVSICPTSLDAEHYADIIRRLSICRQVIAMSDQVAAIGYNQEPDSDLMLSQISEKLETLRKENLHSKKLITPRETGDVILNLISTYNQPDNAIGSGFYDLDIVTTGFYEGEMTILGARPSVGKTQIMLDMAENMATRTIKVLFCSVEMSIIQIMERKVSRNLKVPIRILRHKGLSENQMDAIATLAGQASETSIYYLTEGTSVIDIERELSILTETTGVDILFVDYLQRLKDCWEGKENMNIRTGRVSWALKSMAKEYDIPVIVASQLSRASEVRENKRPTLADLRDSGAIEQDADNVLLLYRDEESPDYMEVKQAKNRQLGEHTAIKLLWNHELRRYVNIAR